MTIYPVESMGTSDLGWLQSLFHFSFADYFNPARLQFGVLRVLNDDLIQPNSGFDMHHHRDMEIISYVVDGELTHGDSMGNEKRLVRGEVQYMSAGSGVAHSEHNFGSTTARFLQIWIVPDRRNGTPRYGDFRFPWENRVGKWLEIASSENGSAPVRLYQDVSISVRFFAENETDSLEISNARQLYGIVIEGEIVLDGKVVRMREAFEIVESGRYQIRSCGTAHVMIIEMALRI